MSEAEECPKPLELETSDGRPIAYIGPHPSLIPEMKSIICPLLGICSAVPLDRAFDHLKRDFEWMLWNNATFMVRDNGQDVRLQKRGLSPERVNKIGKSILSNQTDLSAYIEYRHASEQESGQLSHYH